jgi:hypothetical protein
VLDTQHRWYGSGVVEAGQQRPGAHVYGEALVLGEEFPLALRDRRAVGAGGREGEEAPGDRAVEEQGPDTGIADLEAVQEVELRVRVLGDGSADPNDPGGGGGVPVGGGRGGFEAELGRARWAEDHSHR